MYTKKIIKSVLVISFFLVNFYIPHVVFALDPSVHVFPNTLAISHQASAVKDYRSVLRGIDAVFEQSKIASKDMFPTDKYKKYKETLQGIIQKYPDDTIRPFAERRLVLLDWLAGKTDAKKTSTSLLSLADSTKNSQNANFTRGFACTILSRDGDVDEASKIFGALETPDTPHFGWFAFAMIRYHADFAAKLTPQQGDKMSGNPVREDYDRKMKFADFVESIFLPQVKEYLKDKRDYSGIDRDNVVLCLRRAVSDVHQVLGPRIYLDLSRRCSDNILPELLKTWQASLSLLDPAQRCLEVPEFHQKTIKVYFEKIIPRLNKLQKQREFNQDFLQLMRTSQISLEELIPGDIENKQSEKKQSNEYFIPKASIALSQGKPFVFGLQKAELIHNSTRFNSEKAYEYFAKLGKGDIIWDGVIMTVRGAKILNTKQESHRTLKYKTGKWSNTYKLPKEIKLPYTFIVINKEEHSYLMTIKRIEHNGIKVDYRKLAANEIKRYLFKK